MKSSSTQLRLIMGLFLAVGLANVAMIERETFYSGDSSVSYLQILALRRNAPGDLSVPLSAETMSAPRSHFPLQDGRSDPNFLAGRIDQTAFVHHASGRWYVSHPLLLPLLSWPFVALLGSWGLYVLPLISGLVVIALLGKVATRLGVDPVLPCGILALATPLIFYASEFWGHTPAAALFLGAVFLTMEPDFASRPARGILAGALLGIASAIRSEMLLVASLWLLWMPLMHGRASLRSALRAGLAFLVVGGAILGAEGWFEHRLFSHLRINVTLGGGAAPAESSLPERIGAAIVKKSRTWMDNVPPLLWSHPEMGDAFTAGLALPFLLAILVQFFGGSRFPRILELLLTLGAVGVALRLVVAVASSPTYPSGLLAACPILALGLAPHSSLTDPRLRRLACFCGIYLLVLPVAGPAGGWQMGPRYYLPCFPLLALVVGGGPRIRPAVGGLIVLCVLTTGLVLSERRLKHETDGALLAWTRNAPRHILADHWFFAWNVVPQVLEKELRYVDPAPESLAAGSILPLPAGADRCGVVARTAEDYGALKTALEKSGFRESALERPVLRYAPEIHLGIFMRAAP